MPQIILKITFDTQTKQIGVEGPINQKMLCYGMLECARDAIHDESSKPANQSQIVAASPLLAAQLTGAN